MRNMIASLLLSATIAAAFGLPKPAYESPQILDVLEIPGTISGWRSVDFAPHLDVELDDRYSFISDVFARVYGNQQEQSLLFLILDAGNFHHPKVCFTSSGFSIRELADTVLTLPNGGRRVSTLLAERGELAFVVLYWMTIDQTEVDWTEQKFRQFLFSLFNKKKIGLMGRLDIPLDKGDTKGAQQMAQAFIENIGRSMSDEQSAYLFGK